MGLDTETDSVQYHSAGAFLPMIVAQMIDVLLEEEDRPYCKE